MIQMKDSRSYQWAKFGFWTSWVYIIFPWEFVTFAMPLIWQPSIKTANNCYLMEVSSGTRSISGYHGATGSARRKSDIKWGGVEELCEVRNNPMHPSILNCGFLNQYCKSYQTSLQERLGNAPTMEVGNTSASFSRIFL